MPGSIFGIAARPTSGQGVIWQETLGGRMDVGALAQTASGITGLTLNRVPFGNSLGGLQDSANLTWDGATLTLTGGANATSIGATTPGTGAFTTLSATGAVSLTSASSGLTISKTSGTTLVVSSTASASSSTNGCATFAGGIGVAGKLFTGDTLTTVGQTVATNNPLFNLDQNTATNSARMLRFLNSGSGAKYNFTISAQLNVDDALEFTPSTAAGGTTFSTPALSIAGATGLVTISAAGLTSAGPISITSTTDSTSIGSGALIVSGGIGVAKRITLDGATGKTLRIVNAVANSTVAVTLGSTGPVGSTVGAPQGWMRVDINGTDRYMPFW
jgi:hypothetical protein